MGGEGKGGKWRGTADIKGLFCLTAMDKNSLSILIFMFHFLFIIIFIEILI